MSPLEPMLSRRLDRVAPSAILALVAKARALAAQGVEVIDLGIGEPDFETPPHVIEAAARAMRAGETKYTVLSGTPALREAVAAKFRRENGLDFGLDEITCSTGAKQVIFNAMTATLDPGDEVIIPAPYWASYPDITRFAGGTPVAVECAQAAGFRLSPQALEAAITPATKWLVLNSPGNPTGAAYSAAQLAALGEVLASHPRVLVLSDDIYEHLRYDDAPFATMAGVCPKLRARTLTVNGVSKAYAMTGWRLGYAGGPAELIRGMNTVQGQSTSAPSSVSQAASVAALNGPQDFLSERRAAFEARRELVVDGLNAMDGIDCHRPEGAFYVYPHCGALLGRCTPGGKRLETDADVCTYLLEQAAVSLVPGSAFGQSPHFRLSYAASREALAEALRRIEAAVAELR